MTTAQLVAAIVKAAGQDEQFAADISATLLASQPIWYPLKGPQTSALESKADIILFGGAAGGGKTDLACGLSLTAHQRTLFIRQEATQLLPVYDRIGEIVGTRDGLSGKDKVWRVNTSGKARQIQFGGVPNPGDENRFQGNPRDLLVLDEAANLRESQVRFLMGWVRTTDPGQRTRVLMCSNPPTNAEGRWIIDFFAPWLSLQHKNPAKPGELRWFVTIGVEDIEVSGPDEVHRDGQVYTPQSRTFIPSRINDNPYLVNTNYMRTLQAMPEPLRSQMLLGDFTAGMEDDAYQVIPMAWVVAAMARWTPQGRMQPMSAIGLDVARGGPDQAVIAPRHGDWFDELTVIPGREVPDGQTLLGRVVAMRRSGAPIQVDAIGVGTSVLDQARENEIQCIAMTGSEKASGMDRTGTFHYKNRRSQWHWEMREVLDPTTGHTIALPPDEKLKADLCAPTFDIQGDNVLIVEGKKHIAKRLGRSTDRGDAVVYANVSTPKSALVRNVGSKRFKVKTRNYGKKT